MARKYSVCGNATNTQSSTLPLVTLISTAAVRPSLYDIILSSDATPADNAGKIMVQRCTTAGTAGSSITPQPLDTSDAAAVVTSGLAIFSVGPTLTASAFVLSMAFNQRPTVRWVTDPTDGIILPSTANNGVALMPTVTTSAFNTVFTLRFQE